MRKTTHYGIAVARRVLELHDHIPVIVVENRTSHTLSVPHKMISESPACLNCPNGVRGSFAGPLVKSTYVKLTGNARPGEVMRGGPDVSFGEVWNILASLAACGASLDA